MADVELAHVLDLIVYKYLKNKNIDIARAFKAQCNVLHCKLSTNLQKIMEILHTSQINPPAINGRSDNESDINSSSEELYYEKTSKASKNLITNHTVDKKLTEIPVKPGAKTTTNITIKVPAEMHSKTPSRKVPNRLFNENIMSPRITIQTHVTNSTNKDEKTSKTPSDEHVAHDNTLNSENFNKTESNDVDMDRSDDRLPTKASNKRPTKQSAKTPARKKKKKNEN